MFKKLFLFFFVTLFFSAPYIHGQMHYLNKYTGIPIVAVYTNVNADQLTTANYARLRELGAIGILTDIHNQAEYDSIYAHGMRIIPYNVWGVPNWVTDYCDAVYTRWQAEGHLNDTTNGVVELKHKPIGSVFTQGNISGISTSSSQAGELIYGPGYGQYVTYKQLPTDTTHIKYTATFRLKIEQISSPLPLDFMNKEVCTIKVVASNPEKFIVGDPAIDTVLFQRKLYVSDFVNTSGIGWNEWKLKSIEDYKLDKINSKTSSELNDTTRRTAPQGSNYDSRWMQFKVDWAGNNFMKLYVDYIEVFDEKGISLKTDPDAATDIKNLVSLYSDTARVLGWGGLNEPGTIDNFEPIRMVDSLVQVATNNKLHLYETFKSGWTGLVGHNKPGGIDSSNGYVYIAEEFFKRTKLPYISMNLYNYHYPYYRSETRNYYLNNIDYVITNLKKLTAYNRPFAYSTQSGRFYIYDDECKLTRDFVNPSPAQMMYHIYLGLLFGMKELTMDPFFTLVRTDTDCYGLPYRDGLVDAETNELTELGIAWKNKVVPLTSGLPGKTLKNASQTGQVPNINLETTTPVSITGNHHLDKLSGIPLEAPYMHRVDAGFFKQSQSSTIPEYIMLVNRWYSSDSAVHIDLKKLEEFENWTVKNLTDTSYYYLTADAEDKAYFDDMITPGNAALYSIFPAVKNGGQIITRDSIKHNTTLTGKLIITAGDTLYINAVYTLRDTVFVEDGGFVNVLHGGAIAFESGGALVYQDWSDCLVINQNTSHPKLIWQKYGTGYQYKIYRKKETVNFVELTTITSDTVTSYTDNAVTINFGPLQSNETYSDYYVIVGDIPSRTWVSYDTTNTARVTRVQGNQQEKAASESEHKITEYDLEQNYPNPFNPITTIRYQVPKDSKVTLTVYDILGTEVALLVDEVKPMGRYEVKFNSATANGGLASGMYIYKLQAGNYSKVRKMVLLK